MVDNLNNDGASWFPGSHELDSNESTDTPRAEIDVDTGNVLGLRHIWEQLEIPQIVTDSLIRAQQRLIYAKYKYVWGDEHLWPACAVGMTQSEPVVLIAPWPGAQHAETLAQMWTEVRKKASNTGLVLIGIERVDSTALDEFFKTVKGQVAYFDVERDKHRYRGLKRFWFQNLRIMTRSNLKKLLKPHKKSASIDCEGKLKQALTGIRETNRFIAASTLVSGIAAPVATFCLAGVCVALFVMMMFMGGEPTLGRLIKWGALYGPLVRAGQWWRLLTCGFVHGGVMHIFFNASVLVALGKNLELFQGWKRMACFFLFSVVTGSIASLWSNPVIVSVGASGGVFGVMGALTALIVRFRGDFPTDLRKQMTKGILPFLLYNGIFSLLPFIDWAAHAGGFVGGFLIALILGRSPLKRTRPGLRAQVAASILAVATAFAAYNVVRTIPPDAPLEPAVESIEEDPEQSLADAVVKKLDRMTSQLKPDFFMIETVHDLMISGDIAPSDAPEFADFEEIKQKLAAARERLKELSVDMPHACGSVANACEAVLDALEHYMNTVEEYTGEEAQHDKLDRAKQRAERAQRRMRKTLSKFHRESRR